MLNAGFQKTLFELREADGRDCAGRSIQAARELLLAQSSDWAFIMKTGTSVDYAVRRFKTHLHRFDRLANMVEYNGYDDGYLHQVAWRDSIFPDMDYRVFRICNYFASFSFQS